jgi:tetraacyldisaccharide 4'-kinase
MAAALQRAWLRRGALAWLLAPIALLYGALAALHRALYRTGMRRVERLPVPVVVVGNVVAGGAGKTPVVLALVEHLRRRGLAAGVVSRGYGRQGHETLEVTPATDPALAGDEPLLVATRGGVPVVVDARRPQAARTLLAAHPEVRVIVSDDGLQHHALGRDIEIVVFDERGIGNGWLLPAGPLRESWPRHADLVLHPKGAGDLPGFALRRRLGPIARRADGTQRSLAELSALPCTAVAGIARPEAFFAMLRAARVPLEATLALPDHHDFAAPLPPVTGALLCTEKDAAKLWRTHPEAWAVPLEVEIDPAFWPAFDRLLDARLSSPDGSQTA